MWQDSRQMEEGEENVDNWINPIIVPVCLTNQLKSCFLHGYKSTTCQDRFVRYVMLNSNSLKTISIKCLPSTDTTVKYGWLKKLASWRRSSTTSLLFDWWLIQFVVDLCWATVDYSRFGLVVCSRFYGILKLWCQV